MLQNAGNLAGNSQPVVPRLWPPLRRGLSPAGDWGRDRESKGAQAPLYNTTCKTMPPAGIKKGPAEWWTEPQETDIEEKGPPVVG